MITQCEHPVGPESVFNHGRVSLVIFFGVNEAESLSRGHATREPRYNVPGTIVLGYPVQMGRDT